MLGMNCINRIEYQIDNILIHELELQTENEEFFYKGILPETNSRRNHQTVHWGWVLLYCNRSDVQCYECFYQNLPEKV